MDRTQILAKVIEIVVDELDADLEKVTEQSSFMNDLGADSLDSTELIMRFEDAFSLEIPDADALKITTVREAVDYIETALTQKNGST